MNEFDDTPEDGQPELDALFAGARAWTPADLGAADRFLNGPALATRHQGARRHGRRLWAGAALGLAAALGGLTLLRPDLPPLPASAAYSVYQSALGDGW